MLTLISHRGNLAGPTSRENEPLYIDEALKLGFDVEIDLWKNQLIYLGHDSPQYETSKRWLLERSPNLWVHCKNIEALNFCEENKKFLNYFWHQQDDYCLTSRGFIWVYPGKPLSDNGILVNKDLKTIQKGVKYICSDWVENIRRSIL